MYSITGEAWNIQACKCLHTSGDAADTEEYSQVF